MLEGAEVVEYFNDRLPEMLAAIQTLAEIESPSSDMDALESCAAFLNDYVFEMTGTKPTWIRSKEGQPPHLQVDLGDRADVILIGHFDTVHPIGSLEIAPCHISGDRFYGPGVLDMKSGVVMIVEIARFLLTRFDRPNVRLFFNSDEEVGSANSAPFLRAAAKGAKAAFVFESTLHEGVLKTGARGVREITITATGKGGHAAYPEHYVNPVDAIAEIIIAAKHYHRPTEGTVVTATLLEGSSAHNAVPETASVGFSIRASSDEMLDIAEKGIGRIRVSDPRIDLHVKRIAELRTFEKRDDNKALALAKRACAELGLPEPMGIEARGASDANQIADLVPDGIEGLGGWGDGLHDLRHEYIHISSIIPSTMMSAMMTVLAITD